MVWVPGHPSVVGQRLETVTCIATDRDQAFDGPPREREVIRSSSSFRDG